MDAVVGDLKVLSSLKLVSHFLAVVSACSSFIMAVFMQLNQTILAKCMYCRMCLLFHNA